MKKIGVFLALFLVLSLVFVFAAEEDETPVDPNSENVKIENAFSCLEERAGTCEQLQTNEIVLTIMATPDNIFDNCVSELEKRASSIGWDNGNIKNTAMAVLALQHAGRDTTEYEELLMESEIVPDNLNWYIQQDSNEEAICNIAYDGSDYDITISSNKKITAFEGVGDCLSVKGAAFWISVDKECFEKDISIKCDKDFIVNLLYKNSDSSSNTIYVLDETQSSPKFGSLTSNIKSKCFGDGSSCDYEDTVWAALALLKTGHEIDDYIPYITAMSESYPTLMPDAFVYMITNSNDFAKKLVSQQTLGSYWDSGSGSRYYDTAIALLALGTSSSEQITAARDWLLFTQGNDGCWSSGSNAIKDTAAVLWAIVGRAGRDAEVTGGTTPFCEDVDSFCIPTTECPEEEVLDNFYCTGLSNTCCASENLKTCSEYEGQLCDESEFCVGNERRSSDVDECCTGTCEERPQENECEAQFYTCMDSCSDYQESVSYSCDGAQVCCKSATNEDSGNSHWWIWAIIAVLVIGLGALAYVYRDKIKEKLGKGKGPGSRGPPRPRRPGMPPRGPPRRPLTRGMPPMTRQRPIAPPRTGRPYKEDPAMKETFRKLRKIAAR